MHLGITKINCLNDRYEHVLCSTYFRFEKGIEIGSKNYVEHVDNGLVHYLRVGDLDNLSSTYINENIAKNIALEDDILIAFDGAPGRNNVGLLGAFSSGIYKVICERKYKGLAFFELNSQINKKIIADHSQGTTILHASKAIPFLECCNCDLNSIEYFNFLFLKILELKKKITYLNNVKKILLRKYF